MNYTMNPSPGNIKVIVAAGVSLPDAIKAALPGTSAEFAAKYGLFPAHVSVCIRGKQRHERVREALAKELEVEREWLDEQLDGLARREVAA